MDKENPLIGTLTSFRAFILSYLPILSINTMGRCVSGPIAHTLRNRVIRFAFLEPSLLVQLPDYHDIPGNQLLHASVNAATTWAAVFCCRPPLSTAKASARASLRSRKVVRPGTNET
jgi:hypothetical protein